MSVLREAAPLRAPSATDAHPIRLNVGGGKGHPALPGWLILDLRESADVQIDVTQQPLPFTDASVELIFTSHMLEHIHHHHLDFVLREFRRVLMPAHEGGRMRILVPDIERACRAYLERDEAFFRGAELTYAHPASPLGGLFASWVYSMSTIGNGHVHCFDFEYLAWWLHRAGFTRVERSEPGESPVAVLRAPGLDQHPNASLCVEAWWNPDGQG